MLISKTQQESNQRNAQQSTGPKTPEGKAHVRFNALTWGLRAQSLIVKGEDPVQYQELWCELEAEYQPQTKTERLYIDQMAIAQWQLIRMTRSEQGIRNSNLDAIAQLPLLERISVQSRRLEASFRNAVQDMQRAQDRRRATKPQPQAKENRPAQPQPATPPPEYVMSGRENNPPPISCAPKTDSR